MAFTPRRELVAFSIVLAVLVGGFFHQSLWGGRILSPADVLFASGSFRDVRGAAYEPANRLLIDPVLQFQPWIEFNRMMLRSGRLPLWNPWAGCGAPHLANGQSAVFDPFQIIAYLGELPAAWGWMAAARLWFAGLGMFLLARSWGLGSWGRWYAGLAFPFCGFLVGWLLFPVTNVAIWLPWVLLATGHVLECPTLRGAGLLGLAVGGCLLGGHVQTSAHVLLAAGAYAAWFWKSSGTKTSTILVWSAGVLLGVGIAAIEVVPLGFYLAKSPVWEDRTLERASPLALVRPRVLDAGCTALPYLFGSQRAGHPNLAKAVGVANLNESAGGFAGLATLIWLAPLGWSARRSHPVVIWLAGLAAFGFLGAFRWPPVDNLLRALPILGVTDNRRLTLWLAFGLIGLGAFGLDRLTAVRSGRGWGVWGWCWVVTSMGLLAAAGGVGWFATEIHSRSINHYAKASGRTPGADPDAYRGRAEEQTRRTLEFLPKYLGLAAAHGLALAALLGAIRSGRVGVAAGRPALLGLTLVDLLGFGYGLNPAIDPVDDRPTTPLIQALRREVGDSGRIIGLGAELPPNTLMRYGLADARNYDSVEVARSLAWFRPLYDSVEPARTSHREITWPRVLEARERLFAASVKAVVGPTQPPDGFEHVEKICDVWVAWLRAAPLIELVGAGRLGKTSTSPGTVHAQVETTGPARLVVRQTYDPGWRAEADGLPIRVEASDGTFLAIQPPSGSHQVTITYDPIEVRMASFASMMALFLASFALTDLGPFRFTRIVLRRLGRTQALGLESDS